MPHLDPNARVMRKAASQILREAGYPVATATLATWASRGGGPPYQLFGRVPLYRIGDLFQWAEARLSAPITSSAEADALRHGDR